MLSASNAGMTLVGVEVHPLGLLLLESSSISGAKGMRSSGGSWDSRWSLPRDALLPMGENSSSIMTTGAKSDSALDKLKQKLQIYKRELQRIYDSVKDTITGSNSRTEAAQRELAEAQQIATLDLQLRANSTLANILVKRWDALHCRFLPVEFGGEFNFDKSTMGTTNNAPRKTFTTEYLQTLQDPKQFKKLFPGRFISMSAFVALSRCPIIFCVPDDAVGRGRRF